MKIIYKRVAKKRNNNNEDERHKIIIHENKNSRKIITVGGKNGVEDMEK